MSDALDFLHGLDEEVDGQLPPDWDPPEAERIYYRHAVTNDRGWHVRRGGRDMVMLDRPNEEILRPLSGHEWNVDKDFRPLTRMHIAQVAFDADRRLCYHLGIHDIARKEWNDLSEPERIFWMREGPKNPIIRGMLYEGIMANLEKIASH